jgi:sec-independent protein translocase protein TatA
MFGIGPVELVLIALAVGVLFFGSGKILDFARSFGRLTGEFKKSKAEIERELKEGEAADKKEEHKESQ